MRSGLDSVPGRWADDAGARVVELVREDSLQATGRYTDVKNAIGLAHLLVDPQVPRVCRRRPANRCRVPCVSKKMAARVRGRQYGLRGKPLTAWLLPVLSVHRNALGAWKILSGKK